MSDYDPNYIHQKSFALVGQKAIILNSDNKILLLKRSDKSSAEGKWSIPGGALEQGEEPFAGIKREIEEETQLQVSDLKPNYVKSYFNKDKDFVVIIGYVCKAESENVILNWEHDEFRWVNKKEALELELTADGQTFLENF